MKVCAFVEFGIWNKIKSKQTSILPFLFNKKNFSNCYCVSNFGKNFLETKKNVEDKKKSRSTFVIRKLSNRFENDSPLIEETKDLTGDKGVIKTILKKGFGPQASTSSKVKVHYKGELENGEIFDSSLDRKDPYVFKIGENKVIKGWEIGVKSMKVGEKAKFVFSSEYGYKKKGIPPIIPPNAKLVFEIELLEILDFTENSISNLSDTDRNIPRTPDKIAEDFERKISKKTKVEKEMKFGNFFFISPFQSQSGEKAPWWLNPNITFVLVFASILLLFFIVFSVGGIHQGYVD